MQYQSLKSYIFPKPTEADVLWNVCDVDSVSRGYFENEIDVTRYPILQRQNVFALNRESFRDDAHFLIELSELVTTCNPQEIIGTTYQSTELSENEKFARYLNQIAQSFSSKLKTAFRDDDYSEIEVSFEDMLSYDTSATLIWAQGLIEQGDEFVFAAILMLLKRMDFSKVHQTAYLMAAAGLHHKSDIVKSSALSLIGRWHNSTALKLIYDFDAPQSAWLKLKYQQIKTDLEKYVVTKD